MTINQVLAVAAILVPAATALLVAYWHRKQLRQIEEFRRDPSAGLRPPPSSVWAFIKSKRQLLVGVGLPALGVILELFSERPVTRWSILVIALGVASMLFATLLYMIDRIVGIVERMLHLQIHEVSERTLELHRHQADFTKRPIGESHSDKPSDERPGRA